VSACGRLPSKRFVQKHFGGGPARWLDKVGPMNSEQLQSLAVLALAMVPVALLWWVWIRMLD